MSTARRTAAPGTSLAVVRTIGASLSTRRLRVVILLLFGFVVLVVSAPRSRCCNDNVPEDYIALGGFWKDSSYYGSSSSTSALPVDTRLSSGSPPAVSRPAQLETSDFSSSQRSDPRRIPPLLSRLGSLLVRRPFSRRSSLHSKTGIVSSSGGSATLELLDDNGDDNINLALSDLTDSSNNNRGFLLARLRSPFKPNEATQPSLRDSAFDEPPTSAEDALRSLTDPLMTEETWNSLTGREFQEHPERVDELATMGEGMARGDSAYDDWVSWNPYGSYAKGNLDDGDIVVAVGRSKRSLHASNVPWIKTKSIVPLSPEEMAALLLDSERVQTYNQLSLGRKDLWVRSPPEDGSGKGQKTKIVKNRTKIPMNSKPMVSVTMMHSRPLESEPGSWLVVSRAVGGTAFLDDDDKGASRSDILLGVNLLQPVPGDDESCVITAITHVYTSAVPSMLAEQLGVKGAVKFVKDVRKLKVAVAAAS